MIRHPTYISMCAVIITMQALEAVHFFLRVLIIICSVAQACNETKINKSLSSISRRLYILSRLYLFLISISMQTCRVTYTCVLFNNDFHCNNCTSHHVIDTHYYTHVFVGYMFVKKKKSLSPCIMMTLRRLICTYVHRIYVPTLILKEFWNPAVVTLRPSSEIIRGAQTVKSWPLSLSGALCQWSPIYMYLSFPLSSTYRKMSVDCECSCPRLVRFV